MPLIILIILATIFYTLFDIFASKAGNRVDANLSSVIFNALGALIPLAVYAYLKFAKGAKLIATSSSGVMYSLLAGISIAIFSILLIKTFEKGGLAYVIPLIYGGSVALASLAGWLIFRESVSALQMVGIAVIIVGIILVIVAKMQISAI
jgi:uncharacterized membrane protein